MHGPQDSTGEKEEGQVRRWSNWGGKEQVIPLFCSRIAEHNCTKQFNFRLPLLFEILKITKIVFHVPPLEPFEHCMRSGLSPEPSVTLLPGAG